MPALPFFLVIFTMAAQSPWRYFKLLLKPNINSFCLKEPGPEPHHAFVDSLLPWPLRITVM